MKTSTSNQSISTLIKDVDWEHLLNLEIRTRAGHDDDNTCLSFFLDHLESLHDQELHDECFREYFTVDDLRQIVNDESESIEYATPMEYSDDELKLWAAIISEYRTVATKIPMYVRTMVLSGIPPALRGLVWKSIAEAHSNTLESLFDSLASEWTKAVNYISRDLHRTFPEIRMFEEEGGDGQIKLGRVLQAYAAYDMQVGYCQGLSFIAGPLLMHMSDRDSFCLLVKLMEDNNLRSMFTCDMSGLPLRMYQFTALFEKNLPILSAHFKDLGVPNIYVSKWFLSLFAATCPLTLLMRMYDLVFAEGALPTLMRTALCILKSNEKELLEFTEEDQILQFVLNSSAWNVFNGDPDLFMAKLSQIDAGHLSTLRTLEARYNEQLKPKASKKPAQANPSLFPIRGPLKSLYPSRSEDDNASFVTTNSKVALTIRSDSMGSIASGDTFSTYVDSPPDSAIERFEETKFATKMEVEVVRSQLEFERTERTMENELVKKLLLSLNKEVLSEESKELTDVLKQRLKVDDSAKGTTINGCANCANMQNELEALRTQEAIAKANEAVARGLIDELSDKLNNLKAPSTHAKKSSWWRSEVSA